MSRVETGLEVWLNRDAEPLAAGSRIALLLHPASVDGSGHPTLERVQGEGRFVVERLLAPEHGLAGREQDMERVPATVDHPTGLPVISLYGDHAASLRPKPEHLAGLDAVVCDLQDVGSRYYTFVYTLSYVMEAAREAGVAVVVLDRPNPLGGIELEGPVLDPAFASFVGRYPIPVRHGMTVAELARFFNDACAIGCDLRVVAMRGWRRAMRFVETGLPWVPPSPNMPTPNTALVYPGGCLVEGTNLSEGRGTTTPFELVGAPWLDPHRLAESMRAEAREGVAFRPASFRPMFHKHAGESCFGVQVMVTDPESFRPFETYLALVRAARRQAPDRFAWRREAYEFETTRLAIDLLLGRADLRPMLETGAGVEAMRQRWESDLESFREARGAFLLY